MNALPALGYSACWATVEVVIATLAHYTHRTHTVVLHHAFRGPGASRDKHAQSSPGGREHHGRGGRHQRPRNPHAIIQHHRHPRNKERVSSIHGVKTLRILLAQVTQIIKIFWRPLYLLLMRLASTGHWSSMIDDNDVMMLCVDEWLVGTWGLAVDRWDGCRGRLQRVRIGCVVGRRCRVRDATARRWGSFEKAIVFVWGRRDGASATAPCRARWKARNTRTEMLRAPQSSTNCQSRPKAGAEWGSKWMICQGVRLHPARRAGQSAPSAPLAPPLWPARAGTIWARGSAARARLPLRQAPASIKHAWVSFSTVESASTQYTAGLGHRVPMYAASRRRWQHVTANQRSCSSCRRRRPTPATRRAVSWTMIERMRHCINLSVDFIVTPWR